MLLTQISGQCPVQNAWCACSGRCYFYSDEDFEAWLYRSNPEPQPCTCKCHNYPLRHIEMACTICGHKNPEGKMTEDGWLSDYDIYITDAKRRWELVKGKYA